MDKRRRSLFRRGPAGPAQGPAQAATQQPAHATGAADEDATLELANALATDMVVIEREDGGENEDDDDDAPIQGTLSKLGDKGIGARMWKQRFVYVKDGRLFYAKKQGEPAQGEVALDQVRKISLNEHPSSLTTPKPKPGTCFDVATTAGGVIHFMAESPAAAQQWVQRLTRVWSHWSIPTAYGADGRPILPSAATTAVYDPSDDWAVHPLQPPASDEVGAFVELVWDGDFALGQPPHHYVLLPSTPTVATVSLPDAMTVADALQRLAQAHPAARTRTVDAEGDPLPDDGDGTTELRIYSVDNDGTVHTLAATDRLVVAPPQVPRFFCLRQPRELLSVHVDATQHALVVLLPMASAEELVADDHLRARALAAATAAAGLASPPSTAAAYHLQAQVVHTDPEALANARSALTALPVPPVGPLHAALDVLTSVMERPPGSTQRLMLCCEFEEAPRALEPATPKAEPVLRKPSGLDLPDLSDEEAEAASEGYELVAVPSAGADAGHGRLDEAEAEKEKDMDMEPVHRDAPEQPQPTTDDVAAPTEQLRETAEESDRDDATWNDAAPVAEVAPAVARTRPIEHAQQRDEPLPAVVVAALPPLESRSLSFGVGALDDDDDNNNNDMVKDKERPAAVLPAVVVPTRSAQRPATNPAPRTTPAVTRAAPQLRPVRAPAAPEAGGKVATVKSPAVLRVLLVQAASPAAAGTASPPPPPLRMSIGGHILRLESGRWQLEPSSDAGSVPASADVEEPAAAPSTPLPEEPETLPDGGERFLLSSGVLVAVYDVGYKTFSLYRPRSVNRRAGGATPPLESASAADDKTASGKAKDASDTSDVQSTHGYIFINQLNRAVWTILKMLPPSEQAADQAKAANDSANRPIGVAIRARLCSAIASVLVHGLIGTPTATPTLWQLVALSVAESQRRQLASEETTTGWVNLAAHLQRDPWFQRDTNRMFRSFCCAQLMSGSLGSWLSAVARCTELQLAHYEAWALLRRPEMAATLDDILRPLAPVPFTLALYFEDVGPSAASPAARPASGPTTLASSDGSDSDSESGGNLDGGRDVSARMRADALAQQVRAEGKKVLEAVVGPLRRIASAEPTSVAPASRRVRSVVTVQRAQPTQPLGLDLMLEASSRLPGYSAPSAKGTVLVVRAVAPNSPAAAATLAGERGFRPGDVIEAVAGQSVLDWTLDQAAAFLRTQTGPIAFTISSPATTAVALQPAASPTSSTASLRSPLMEDIDGGAAAPAAAPSTALAPLQASGSAEAMAAATSSGGPAAATAGQHLLKLAHRDVSVDDYVHQEVELTRTVAGFGLDLALRPGLGVVVTAIARNGAAAKARTPRAGDVITRINRQPVAGLSLDAVRDLLRGTTVARIAFIPADQLIRK